MEKNSFLPGGFGILMKIFFSAKHDGKDWVKAAPLGGNVNTDQNEGAQMISQDGEWLVFTACNRQDGFGSCDIYVSYLTPNTSNITAA